MTHAKATSSRLFSVQESRCSDVNKPAGKCLHQGELQTRMLQPSRDSCKYDHKPRCRSYSSLGHKEKFCNTVRSEDAGQEECAGNHRDYNSGVPRNVYGLSMSGFHLVHHTVQHILPKLNQIKLNLEQCEPSIYIMACTESFLKCDIHNLLNIECYN